MNDKELEFRSRLLSGALRMREGGFDATADILESLLRQELWKVEGSHSGSDPCRERQRLAGS